MFGTTKRVSQVCQHQLSFLFVLFVYMDYILIDWLIDSRSYSL